MEPRQHISSADEHIPWQTPVSRAEAVLPNSATDIQSAEEGEVENASMDVDEKPDFYYVYLLCIEKPRKRLSSKSYLSKLMQHFHLVLFPSAPVSRHFSF